MNATTTPCLMFRKHIAGPVLVAAVAIMFMAAHTSAVPGTATRPRFKAVAFDYFVLFDPDSVVSEVEQIVPGKGRQLRDVWQNRPLLFFEPRQVQWTE